MVLDQKKQSFTLVVVNLYLKQRILKSLVYDRM